jgi:hypothetical protein
MSKTVFSMEYDPKQWEWINELRDNMPKFRAVAMGYIGKAGKDRLKKSFLSGQELNLSAYPRDKKGRRTISYSIGKYGSHVLISSYPVNLFEMGRKLRGGGSQPGKFIITRKFKQAMSSDLNGILTDYDANYLQKELNKI